MAWQLTAIATSAGDGPLLGSVSADDLVQLAYDWAFDYPAFLALAESLVNASVTAAETDLPEGTPVQLVLPNLRGPLGGSLAGSMASAITSAWAKGQLINVDGTGLTPWPGSSAIAYPDDATATLTLQWVKGQPWVWLVIAALVAISATAIYLAVRASSYTMSSASAGSGTIPNPIPWLLRNWWVIPVGGIALAVAPFVVRQVRQAEQAEQE